MKVIYYDQRDSLLAALSYADVLNFPSTINSLVDLLLSISSPITSARKLRSLPKILMVRMENFFKKTRSTFIPNSSTGVNYAR